MERELTNKQSWSHRLNYFSCNHFLEVLSWKETSNRFWFC